MGAGRWASSHMARRHTAPAVDRTEGRTLPISMTTRRSTPGRGLRLVATTLIAWALFVLPLALVAPAQEPALAVLGQVLICGVILGIGRQGVDVLLLRLFIVATGLFVGTVVGELK